MIGPMPTTVYIDDDENGTGNDTTGDGTPEKPYLTEARALKAIENCEAGIIRDIHSRLVYCSQ